MEGSALSPVSSNGIHYSNTMTKSIMAEGGVQRDIFLYDLGNTDHYYISFPDHWQLLLDSMS